MRSFLPSFHPRENQSNMMKLDHIKNWKTSLTILHETTLTSTASEDQRPPTRLVLPVGEAATIYFCVALGLNGTNENLTRCRHRCGSYSSSAEPTAPSTGQHHLRQPHVLMLQNWPSFDATNCARTATTSRFAIFSGKVFLVKPVSLK